MFLFLVVLACVLIVERQEAERPFLGDKTCTYGTRSTNPDPVHKHRDRTWWWHTEEHAVDRPEPPAHGPHQTEAGALAVLKKYEERVLGLGR